MSEELKPCPFCGGKAERHTIEDEEPSNAGGDVICCSRCGASSHVEFGRKENLVSVWNTRADTALIEVERDAAGNVLICTGIAPMTKAYGTLPEAVQYSGMSRTSIYEALKRGDLKARKAGRRTLISFADLETYLASLPTYQVAK